MEAHGSGVWEAAASSLPPPRAPSDWSESILSPNPRPAAQHSDSCPGSQPRLPVWRAPPSLSLPSLPALSLCCSPLVPSSFSLYFSPAVFPLFLRSVPAFLSASISLSLPLRLSLSDVALCPSVTGHRLPFLFPPPLPRLCRPLPPPLPLFFSSLGCSPWSVCPSVSPCLSLLRAYPHHGPLPLSSLPRPASSVSPSPCLSLPLLSGKAAVIYELRTGPAAGAGGPDYSFPEEAACSGMAG